MAHPQPAELPAQLTVIRYPDDLVERHGYGPDHPYPEEVWTSILGPSTLLLWRRLARAVLHAADTPITLPTTELLAAVGLGTGLAKNSVGARTIARMVAFDLARQAGPHGQLLAVAPTSTRCPNTASTGSPTPPATTTGKSPATKQPPAGGEEGTSDSPLTSAQPADTVKPVMCGRYSSSTSTKDLAKYFDVDEVRAEYLPPRYNVAPSLPVYAVALSRTDGDSGRKKADHRVLGTFQWGLVPSWAKDRKFGNRMINARAETLATKPAYRRAFAGHRTTLIPADI